jgi:fluoride ion exporter CrcB/FEX
LIEGGEYARAATYIAGSILLCIMATFAGMAAAAAFARNG